MIARFIDYSVASMWRDGVQVWQAWYCGKTAHKEWRSREKALQHARCIAESIKDDYVTRGIRAMVVRQKLEF